MEAHECKHCGAVVAVDGRCGCIDAREDYLEHLAYLHEIGKCADDCYACAHPYKG
jgi:hypothetical protein